MITNIFAFINGLTPERKQLFDQYPPEMLVKFQDFLDLDPEIYKEFKNLAYQMRRTGRSRYSAETIINVLRWERDLRMTGDEFKINNNYRSIMARVLTCEAPTDFESFFEFRLPDDGL